MYTVRTILEIRKLICWIIQIIM